MQGNSLKDLFHWLSQFLLHTYQENTDLCCCIGNIVLGLTESEEPHDIKKFFWSK